MCRCLTWGVWLVLVCIFAAEVDGQVVESRRLVPGQSSGKFILMDPQSTGIDQHYPIDLTSSRKHLYTGGFACGGIAVGDLNGDGLPEIFFAGTTAPNRLFINEGNMKFVEATESDLTKATGSWASAAAMVDFDNDGDLDLYTTYYDAPNTLHLNEGLDSNGRIRFREVAAQYGLDLVDATIAPAFCDYDRDGDLDLYLLNNKYHAPAGFPPGEFSGAPLNSEQSKYFQVSDLGGGKPGLNIVARTDRLLRNDGGRFVDVTKEAGLNIDPRHGLAATWWDFDVDGWPDLYVSNDLDDPDAFYRNNGDGTFTDVTSRVLPHTPWFSMGADAGDINNDGWPDFIASDMSGTTHFKDKTTMGAMGARLWVMQEEPRQYMRNALFIGTGVERMMEAAYLAGVADSDWTWAAKLLDFDGDGWLDLFFSNGMTRNFNNSDIPFTREAFVGRSEWDYYEGTETRPERNLAYRNMANLRFESVEQSWGLDNVGMSFAVAGSDLDGDGDPDLVVVNMDQPVTLYRNDTSDANRVAFKLRGRKSNREGLGARIEIEAGGVQQTRWFRSLSGFKSSEEAVALFGLGPIAWVDEIRIYWPSGVEQQLWGLDVGHLYVISEPEPGVEELDRKDATDELGRLYHPTFSVLRSTHEEREFDDFRFQPLLPNQLSRLGPGMAWGDVDGDGDDDCWVGGASGWGGELHVNDGNGAFDLRVTPAFENDRGCEDMAGLFFDMEGDGDLDLYVVSGGVEAPPGHPVQGDRLYLNDGAGSFRRANQGEVPELNQSGSCAVAADFDKDGDMDLFVGARVVPAQYPLAPKSHVLRNTDGKFADAWAFDLGMVTGAVWSDANNDGWLDLLVATEWGSIKLLLNREGKLVDSTSAAGLSGLLGWWNSVAAGDVDGDGDMDYVVGNVGLNSKYHADLDHPALIYYGDLDGSGTSRIVESEFEGGVVYPMRGKSCSIQAMPALGERFKTFESFAIASLGEIYTEDRLNGALKLEANRLESGVLINDGEARFQFKPLPELAQIAPVFGVVVSDLDMDGTADIALAQNFHSPQPETGRMDGGLSLVLKGKGDGSFEPMLPSESGVVVPGDAMSLTLSDLNNDGYPDLVFGQNNGDVKAYLHSGEGRSLSVRLKGEVAGARVTAYDPDGTLLQVVELSAGGGYLSQSSATVFFGKVVGRIVVRRPDGNETSREIASETSVIVQLE